MDGQSVPFGFLRLGNEGVLMLVVCTGGGALMFGLCFSCGARSNSFVFVVYKNIQ